MSALVRADATAMPLADESVDLIVTSPPYWSFVEYQAEGQIGLEESFHDFLAALWTVMDECWRVLKPAGSVFVNLGDRMAGSGGHNNPGPGSRPKAYIKTGTRGPGQGARQGEVRTFTARHPAALDCGEIPDQSRMGLPWRFALGCIDRGWRLRAPIVWAKNCIPQNAADRVELRHEDLFHFAKQSPCWADTDQHRQWPSPWQIPTEPSIEHPKFGKHPAPFPQEIPRRCILGWCPPDGVVLDPFGGSGTTAMVARALGRTGIHFDLSADYLRLARWRVFESGHAAKATARTNAERQGDLFGGAA